MGMLIHNRHFLAEQEVKAGEEISQPIPVVEEMRNEIENKKYSKTEINRMSTGELQALAYEEGIENALETSGSQLKKILVEHFGL